MFKVCSLHSLSGYHLENCMPAKEFIIKYHFLRHPCLKSYMFLQDFHIYTYINLSGIYQLRLEIHKISHILFEERETSMFRKLQRCNECVVADQSIQILLEKVQVECNVNKKKYTHAVQLCNTDKDLLLLLFCHKLTL